MTEKIATNAVTATAAAVMAYNQGRTGEELVGLDVGRFYGENFYVGVVSLRTVLFSAYNAGMQYNQHFC